MASNTRDRNSPQMVYDYVQNLLKNNEYQSAVGTCYNYLTQKKIQWSIKLEKLMELFLDLAFNTQKYSKIKQVLKSYRAVTQNQHPDSLKSILQYYRDNKLQQVLREQIKKDQIQEIRKMKNIQDDQASSQIILSSLNPETKNFKQQLKVNLKIVWDGYKAIIDIVRFNQKLEGVYRTTLKKIFDFVDQYNRKHQFKSFCQFIRSGLKNVLNKRIDKADQQKGFYIDIQKEQINTNNIQIRFEQFDLAVKLGLWQQAFQILDDINQIMKVRKGPVKNYLKCGYFQRLSLIFKKSNYWYYHANAFFNYYSIYITKSNLQASQRAKVADKLILSILCIPPSTLQSNQSKQSKQKIASLMVWSNKIPDKQELQEMMISRGVVQNASAAIKQLWYFMFLDFDLTSLAKGLKLLDNISKKGEYKQFIELLQDILIYKQLISIAQVYQRIKYQSLISIIPLPKQKIEKVLFQCHHRKVIDFVLDQKQGVVIFQDQTQETNPYEQLLSCYVDVALLYEDTRKYERDFIVKKTIDFIQTADNYYNQIRVYKIDEYRKKLRKPKQELQERQRERERKLQQEKRNQQLIKRQRQLDEKKEQQERKKLMIQKHLLINEIISIKQKRNVIIANKKIEELGQQQISQLDKQVFEKVLKQVTTRVANDKQNRNKKRFSKIDYAQRQRRSELKQIIQKSFLQQEKQKSQFEKLMQLSKIDFQQKQKLKNEIEKIAPQVKFKIDKHYNQNRQIYEENMKKFRENLTEQFKKKILVQARNLYNEAEAKKKQDQQKRKKDQASVSSSDGLWSFRKIVKKVDQTGKTIISSESNGGGLWKRKQKTQQEASTQQTQVNSNIKKQNKNDSWAFKKGPTIGGTVGNAFSDLKIQDDQKPKKQKWNSNKPKAQQKQQEKKQQGSWFGKKLKQDAKPEGEKNEVKKQQNQNKFVPPPVEKTQQDNKGSWGKGKQTTTTDQKKQQPKKDNQKPKGRGW